MLAAPPSLTDRKANAVHGVGDPGAEGLALTESLWCLASANLPTHVTGTYFETSFGVFSFLNYLPGDQISGVFCISALTPVHYLRA